MTPEPQANKTIDEILETLWEKRGRHSKLPRFIKTESIAEAEQAITQAKLDALPEKWAVNEPPDYTASATVVATRNQAISEMETTIRKMERIAMGVVLENKNDLSDEASNLKLTRLEVISPKGREFAYYSNQFNVELSVQDDNRTLKIFIKKVAE